MTKQADFTKIVENLKVGDTAAELEANLANCFVHTSVFRSVLNDEKDIILGHKGSGKSAMFLSLVNPSSPAPQLENIDVAPAFALAGSLAFRGLRGNTNPSGQEANFAWRVFVVDRVTQHLIQEYPDFNGIQSLRESRELLGFSSPSRGKTKPWRGFKQLFDPEPLSLSGPPTKQLEPDPDTVAEVLDECRIFLRNIGRASWIVFDRLDEAFYEKPGLERTLLRELLELARELNTFDSEIRIKAFLRNDIYERLTGRGKDRLRTVNATHLRKEEITWPRDQIAQVVCRRLVELNPLLESLVPTGLPLQNALQRESFLAQIFPSAPPQDFHYWPAKGNDTFSWVLSGTAFGGAHYSPRNVLDFLNQCRVAQQDWDANNVMTASRSTLFLPEVLRTAAMAVSRLRYNDTLMSEFPGLGEFVPKMKNRAPSYNDRKHLMNVLDLSNERADHAHELLVESGLLESVAGSLMVARIYRPALETTDIT